MSTHFVQRSRLTNAVLVVLALTLTSGCTTALVGYGNRPSLAGNPIDNRAIVVWANPGHTLIKSATAQPGYPRSRLSDLMDVQSGSDLSNPRIVWMGTGYLVTWQRGTDSMQAVALEGDPLHRRSDVTADLLTPELGRTMRNGHYDIAYDATRQK